MLLSIFAKQLQKGIGNYIETTFPMINEPYVAMHFPFCVAAEMPSNSSCIVDCNWSDFSKTECFTI